MSPEAPKAKSFADILQQNQEFIAHLRALQEDAGGQLEEREKELAIVKRQLAEKQQELDELQNAQLHGEELVRPVGLLTQADKGGISYQLF